MIQERSTELLYENPQKTFEAFLALDLVAWCQRHRPEVRKGVPYLFNEPWLDEIYTDQTREKVIMKAAQVRVSEYLISEALWRMDAWGWSIFYAFPAFSKISDFVKSRVSPAIAACPHMKAVMGTDETRIKTFSSSSIFFSGAQREDQVTSASVDEIIRDEYEFIPPEILPAITKRIGDSPHKFIRDVSHPRFPDTGIHARYQESDQREWFTTCPNPKCTTPEQSLEWDQVRFDERTADLCRLGRPVPAEAITINCRACGTALDRGARGRWIPQNPDSGIAGWHISKLTRAGTNLSELVANSAKTAEYEIQAFNNYDLGRPYSPKGMQIERGMLDALVDREYHLPSSARFSFMGVDVGTKLHVWIEHTEKDGRSRVLFFGAVDDFDDLDRFLPRFGVRTVVVDALPETREARKWITKHRNRAALCYFMPPTDKSAETIRFDKDKAIVHANRTMLCDENERDITERRLILPAEATSHKELYPHFMAMRRIKEQNRSGEVVVSWDSSNKPDHLFFARDYAIAARMLYRKQGYGRGTNLADGSIGIVDGTQRQTQEADW